MSYEERREAYMSHIRECRRCLSNFGGRVTYGLRNNGEKFIVRQSKYGDKPGAPVMHVGYFCDTGRQLVEACCQN